MTTGRINQVTNKRASIDLEDRSVCLSITVCVKQRATSQWHQELAVHRRTKNSRQLSDPSSSATSLPRSIEHLTNSALNWQHATYLQEIGRQNRREHRRHRREGISPATKSLLQVDWSRCQHVHTYPTELWSVTGTGHRSTQPGGSSIARIGRT